MYKLKSRLIKENSEDLQKLIIKTVFDVKIFTIFAVLAVMFTAGSALCVWQIHLKAPLMMMYFLLFVFFTGALIVLITLLFVLFSQSKVLEIYDGDIFVKRSIAGLKDEKDFILKHMSNIRAGMDKDKDKEIYTGEILFDYGTEVIALLLVNMKEEADEVIDFISGAMGN